jgi:putative transcriptional regulator
MKKNHSRITKELLETAKGMHKIGILDDKTYKKITKRHLGKEKLLEMEPITSDEIRSIRENEHISQAVFANYLNLTVGYISQLERGLRRPSGAVLALLNIVRHKGLNAILY